MDVTDIWRIQLFGGLCALRGGRVRTQFRDAKPSSLLAYLACHRQSIHPREVLAEQLWPGDSSQASRQNLDVVLHRLRKQLEGSEGDRCPLLLVERGGIRLHPELATTDIDDFESNIHAAEREPSEWRRLQYLTASVEQHGAGFLPGFYDDWIIAEQQRLGEAAFQALLQLIECLERIGQLPRALDYSLRAMRMQPYREEAYCQAVRLHARLGQPQAALARYRELEGICRSELNTSPSAAAQRLIASIEHLAPAASTVGLVVPIGEPEPPLPQNSVDPEATGGALAPDSRFYEVRAVDCDLEVALARWDRMVRIEGPRHAGKTSLLGRGLQQARALGYRVVITDLRSFNTDDLQSPGTFLLAAADAIAQQVSPGHPPEQDWRPERSPNSNFQRFLRRVALPEGAPPLLWAIDEADRLFQHWFAGEIFCLFRSIYNESALSPAGAYSRLSLVIAYATETHRFISDVNSSPFNVGTLLRVGDFTIEQVVQINCRYGFPLATEAEVERFYQLVAGHPYLTSQGLNWLAYHRQSLGDLVAQASCEQGPFGGHLRRMFASISGKPELLEVLEDVLSGKPYQDADAFYHLCSAGVLSHSAPGGARPRCTLYADYLRRRLPS